MRGAVLAGLVLAALFGATSVRAQAQTPAEGQPPNAMQQGSPASATDTRELLEAARATAKAARENVDYARVVPDILTQILAKLDKIEDKLDKVENAVKAGQTRRGATR